MIKSILQAAPVRAGSVIATVYGDAILPRGGSLPLADLLRLMARLGIAEGVVRTAISRLARDGLLIGQKTGRRSAYALTEHARTEFTAAVPLIYGPLDPPWDGRLRLAFPEPGTDRTALERAGFALLAPGVLVSPHPAASDPVLEATGPSMPRLAARAWPLHDLAEQYRAFAALHAPLDHDPATPLDAIASRTLLLHAWRRIALRDPRLPAGLLPPDWPGHAARALCRAAYLRLLPSSEAWLDAIRLPPGPDPAPRFRASSDRTGSHVG